MILQVSGPPPNFARAPLPLHRHGRKWPTSGNPLRDVRHRRLLVDPRWFSRRISEPSTAVGLWRDEDWFYIGNPQKSHTKSRVPKQNLETKSPKLRSLTWGSINQHHSTSEFIRGSCHSWQLAESRLSTFIIWKILFFVGWFFI